VLKSKAIDTINSILLYLEPSESDGARGMKMDENVIEARLKEPFSISLNALPTAGYTWTATYDSSFLKLENERFQSSQTEAIGGSGMQIFTFTPILVGKVEITALYKRPWENTAQDKKTFIVMVRE
jgi:predicted secreted protein